MNGISMNFVKNNWTLLDTQLHALDLIWKLAFTFHLLTQTYLAMEDAFYWQPI